MSNQKEQHLCTHLNAICGYDSVQLYMIRGILETLSSGFCRNVYCLNFQQYEI